MISRKLPSVLLAGAAILALALTNYAQNSGGPPGQGGQGGQGGPNGPPRGGRRPPPDPLLMAIDLNKDGELSADEIAKASQSLLKLDKNGDGKLSGDELRPRPPGGGPPGGGSGQRGGGRLPNSGQSGGNGAGQGQPPQPPPSPLMTALDLDGDGELSADEIAKAPQSLLKLDKNGDGKLSRDELRPQRPDGNGPPNGGPGQ